MRGRPQRQQTRTRSSSRFADPRDAGASSARCYATVGTLSPDKATHGNADLADNKMVFVGSFHRSRLAYLQILKGMGGAPTNKGERSNSSGDFKHPHVRRSAPRTRQDPEAAAPTPRQGTAEQTSIAPHARPADRGGRSPPRALSGRHAFCRSSLASQFGTPLVPKGRLLVCRGDAKEHGLA